MILRHTLHLLEDEPRGGNTSMKKPEPLTLTNSNPDVKDFGAVQHPCGVCGMVFNRRRILNDHMLTHSNALDNSLANATAAVPEQSQLGGPPKPHKSETNNGPRVCYLGPDLSRRIF